MSPEDFERLLQWLGPDRDLSAKKYVELHAHLSKWFSLKGCNRPEDLSDEVFNRIAKRVRPRSPEAWDIRPLLGFAYYVFREHWREEIRLVVDVDPDREGASTNDTALAELRALCLEVCLQRLGEDGQLIRDYHKYPPGQKVEHRKAMAEARQSTLNAIRLRVSRLMPNVESCVKECCRSRGIGVQ